MYKKYKKFKKRVTQLFHVTEGPATTGYASLDTRPDWVDSVTIKDDPLEFAWDERKCAEGLGLEDPFSVVRNDTNNDTTLGVIGKRGFLTGKHVFEFEWERRGWEKTMTIGVCNEGAPIVSNTGGVSLVGDTSQSWGWDIVRRKAVFHKNATIYPPKEASVTISDRILMFIDMDEGTLSFGCAGGAYWGITHRNLKRPDKHVYPMVGIDSNGSSVKMTYKGSSADYEHPSTATPAGTKTNEPLDMMDSTSNAEPALQPDLNPTSTTYKPPNPPPELKTEQSFHPRITTQSNLGFQSISTDPLSYYDTQSTYYYQHEHERELTTGDDVPLTEL